MRFQIYDRKYYETLEEKWLAKYATLSKEANKTRIYPEEEHAYRTALQRDRDRIIHSRAFRRLKHKQQVFLISEGDHYRTRLTHTLEVAQLARTMANALGINELLVEAIALGHDLGHTPFGHIGEVVLNQILSGKDTLSNLIPQQNFGGFKHNYQSLRVLDKIEKKYLFNGLNLSAFVREGILKHTRLLRDKYHYPDFVFEGLRFDLDSAVTIEGQVVAICDEIAQRTHDLEDGIRAGLVELEEVRKITIIKLVEDKYGIKQILKSDRYVYRNKLIHGLINLLVDDILETTLKGIDEFFKRKKRLSFFDEEIVKFSKEIDPLQVELDHFIYQHIIHKCTGNDFYDQNKNIVKELFKLYIKKPELLPEYIRIRIEDEAKRNQLSWRYENIRGNSIILRNIADHIAGMTDNYAASELKKVGLDDNQI